MKPLLKPFLLFALGLCLLPVRTHAGGLFNELAETAPAEVKQAAAAKTPLSQQLYQAKQIWQDLHKFQCALELYADWVKCGSERARRAQVRSGLVTVAQLNKWAYNTDRAMYEAWHFGGTAGEYTSAVSDDWIDDSRYPAGWDQQHLLPERDVLGNPFGPFKLGEAPKVNPATEAALAPALAALSHAFWADYANASSPGTASVATPGPAAPLATPAAAGPTSEQVETANAVLKDLGLIEQAMKRYAEQQRIELKRHQFMLKTAQDSVRHTSPEYLASYQERVRKEQQVVEDLSAKLAGEREVPLAELNPSGQYTGAGAPYDPIRIGVQPRVPKATADRLHAVLPPSFWGDYARPDTAAE